MADVNLGGLERKIDALSQSASRMEDYLARSDQRLNQVTADLTKVNEDLQGLAKSFQQFMDENKRDMILQKASTELVRVRQELDQEFGGYKVVRETMLGVLQATDLALVKKTTISQVTEELMLSTPDYWLAPCLVAVSAWIGNNRDLAERAIAEAVRRDEEKTSLTMALICRRNNRIDTCYEWLSIYFANQSAMNFTESNFTYLNAYLNGVFGPDKRHMCDDYVAKWMKEIQSNGEEFENRQIEKWNSYCGNFATDPSGQFPELSSCALESKEINDYIGRIGSVDRIANTFSGMKNAEVDQQLLKKNIDQTLVELISRPDAKEEPLRREERYLIALNYFDGDREAAGAFIRQEDQQKTDDKIDLISQMTNVIVQSENSTPSKRKTAVSFLSSYIRRGFEKYITEKRPSFPQNITLAVEDWTGTSSDGENGEALKADFESHMEQKRAEAVQAVHASTKPQNMKIGAAVLGVLGLVMLMFIPILGAVCLVAAVFCYMNSSKAMKEIEQKSEETAKNFQERTEAGKQKIELALSEWKKARNIVSMFESHEIRDVVA